MINYVRAVSWADAEDLVEYEKGPWISIGSKDENSPVVGKCSSVLELRFDDVTDRDYKYAPKLEHAALIVAFVRALHDADAEYRLHVHCAAGVSRSGAVAEWTQRHASFMDRADFETISPQVRPNNLLMKLLDDASGVNRALAAQFGEVE